jgi:hypothetical protein
VPVNGGDSRKDDAGSETDLPGEDVPALDAPTASGPPAGSPPDGVATGRLLPPGMGPGTPPAGEPAGRFVTIRSMAIACALMPILALWVVLQEAIWYSGHSTAISLFYHVTFVVFLLGVANLGVKRLWPSAALDAREMVTIYMMLAIAGTFCSHDMLQILVPMISYPLEGATASNRWGELILPHIPKWAILQDKAAAHDFQVGNASLYEWRVLKAWLGPLGLWFGFLVAFMAALLCINILFRRPWTEKERLSFPIIQIPMMISTGLSKLLRNKLFWIGFAITATIDTVNGFRHFYPSIPEIPIVRAFSFNEYLVERPWNAIAGTTINLYPFVIGLAFFLPTDLAFSCWFFFVMYLMQRVVTAAIGIHDLPGFPFTNEQAAGGYFALGLLALWLSRRHFRGVFRTVLGRPGGIDDSREPLTYRRAFIDLVICACVLVAVGSLLGGSLHVMIVFFLIFFVYSIAIARMRAELGPPAHDLHATGPGVLMHNALGTRALGDGNMTAFASFWWFNRAYRAHFSAHSMEGFKLAQLTRTRSRSMMVAMVVAVIVGSIAAFWAVLHACYVHGAAGKVAGHFASEGWGRMANWMNRPQDPRYAATAATVIGLLFTLLLGALRMRFTWWLWHPVGYATSMSWSMGKMWFCIFLGWLAKLLITRYGGAKAYRKALPFVVGIVLGEFVVGSLWQIYGSIYSTKVYHFWG